MSSPEKDLGLNDLINQMVTDGSYEAGLVGAGLLEIYKTGNYGTMFVPERLTYPKRSISFVQMSLFLPDGEIGLLEFVPQTSPEVEETLRRVITQQVDALDVPLEIGEKEVVTAVDILRSEKLKIAGAFQLGNLMDGTRSMEIIYPLPFLKITHSVELAAALAAGFVRAVSA